jgi:hypothetical protein
MTNCQGTFSCYMAHLPGGKWLGEFHLWSVIKYYHSLNVCDKWLICYIIIMSNTVNCLDTYDVHNVDSWLNSSFLESYCSHLSLSSIYKISGNIWDWNLVLLNTTLKHSGQSVASHGCGLGLISDQAMWDLWWTKWHWGRFPQKYFSFPSQFSFQWHLHPIIWYC